MVAKSRCVHCARIILSKTLTDVDRWFLVALSQHWALAFDGDSCQLHPFGELQMETFQHAVTACALLDSFAEALIPEAS